MIEGLFDANRWKVLFENFNMFTTGIVMTIKVAVLGWLVAMLIGIVFGILCTKKSNIIKGFIKAYVEFFQNTPLPLQVFFYYNGVPMIMKAMFHLSRPVRLSKLLIGVLGIGLYHGAYIAEVIRTGIEAVPKGQKEAAQSQGFSELQTMILIVLPQTLKMILPPLTSQTLNLLKNTSVLAMVAGMDVMYYADSFVSYYGYLQGYVVCAVMYFALCFPLATLTRYFENKTKQIPTEKKSRRKREVA